MATKVVRLPSTLWVGNYEFPMMMVPVKDKILEGDADGCTMFEHGDRGIYIAEHLCKRRTLDVVLHEITHAINWVHDIQDKEPEEGIASKHGIAWSQLYLDNPRFEEWLTYTVRAIRAEREDA
jgi:hypothetical protein